MEKWRHCSLLFWVTHCSKCWQLWISKDDAQLKNLINQPLTHTRRLCYIDHVSNIYISLPTKIPNFNKNISFEY